MKKYISVAVVSLLSLLITFVTFEAFSWYHFGDIPTKAVLIRLVLFFVILTIVLGGVALGLARRKQKEEVPNEEKKPKKKILPMVLLVSLALNVLFILIFALMPDKDVSYKNAYLTEVSFAVQRLEECDESFDEGNYRVAVAHLYAAHKYCALFDGEAEDEFYDLWNLAAAYPDEFCADLPSLSEALRTIKGDVDFENTEAIILLAEYAEKVKTDAVN